MMLKSMSELRAIFKRHRFKVIRNVVDPINGQKKKYATAPIGTGGWGFFDTKQQLQDYAEQLDRVSSYMVD